MKTTIKLVLISIAILNFKQTSAVNNIDSLSIIVNNKSINDTNKVRAINKIGLNFYLNNDLNNSERYLNKALSISEQANYKRGMAVSNALFSGVFLNRNNNSLAIQYAFKSIELYREINDTTCDNYLCNLNTIGTAYSILGLYNKSLEYYLKALSIAEKINNRKGTINFNTNIGSLYLSKFEYEKAESYYLKSFSLTNKNKDTLSLYPNVFLGLAEINYNTKDLNKSLYYYNRFMNIATFTNDSGDICSANIGIANIYKQQKEYNKSIKYLNNSLLFKDDERNSISYSSLADVYKEKGKYKLAEINYNKSLSISKEIQYTELTANTYKKLYQLDSCTHNYIKYMEHHNLYTIYRDSLYNIENEKKMVSTELNYNFDKQKSEIKFKQDELNKINELKSNRQNVIITSIVIVLILLIILSTFIYKSYLNKNKSNKLIKHQKELVEEKQKEIVDNITYAKRIQSSIIPTVDYISKYAKNNFVMYNPKDIVSGDFYWATELNNVFYIATADCTGHGVSGSMMSMLCISALNETVNHRNITNTGDILNDVRKEIIKSLNPIGNEGVNDGMDCVLCAFDFTNKTLQYSASNNSFYIIRNNEIIVCKADKMPIGLGIKMDSFNTNVIQLQTNDVVYMFTDGYADQFGGGNNKKFKYKQLEQLLLSINSLGMAEQKSILNETFNSWKGNVEQTDDVLLIGVKID